ncbi:hypothetical protein T492DRAFT_14154 [Pavlovales sp. CCMP2436]|nr:hypothetical protein T492DRAFT_14154 [Pavlovales sp. CCMP2436]
MSYVLAYMHGVLSYGQWYVDGEEVGPPPLTLLVSFLILYNNLVPISLYVSVEAIKLAMSTFVEADINMYCAEHDAPASSRTSNLHEDLGQVKYVFTDKTGTLTTNEMAFARCSIEGLFLLDLAFLFLVLMLFLKKKKKKKKKKLSALLHKWFVLETKNKK